MVSTSSHSIQVKTALIVEDGDSLYQMSLKCLGRNYQLEDPCQYTGTIGLWYVHRRVVQVEWLAKSHILQRI